MTELLNELCAQYMVMGMTYEEFWNSSVDRWPIYDRYYMLRSEKENQDSWWLGAYIFEGFSTVISNAFNKGSRAKYPDKPHRVTPLTEREQKEQQRKSNEQLRAYFNSLTESINRRKEQRKKDQPKDVNNNGIGSGKPG